MGTYYGEGTHGTCSYGKTMPTSFFERPVTLAAINGAQFKQSVTCGMCVKVTGEGVGSGADPITGEKLVFVKDVCYGCPEGDIDFALTGDGKWDIKVQAVQCPVGDAIIQYSFQGSNAWYIKLMIRNARIPITSLEITTASGNVITPRHTTDNYWTANSNGEFKGPLQVKMTAANGEILYDTVPNVEADQNIVMDGLNRVQVSLDSNLPLPPAADTSESQDNTGSPTPDPDEEGVVNNDVLDMFKNEYHGEGTYYGNGTSGTCSYGVPPVYSWPRKDDITFMALNSPQFMGSVTCGMCFKATGNGQGLGASPITGEYLLFTKDLCPECHEGDIDFALNGDGRWDIKIQAVQCPVADTIIQYSFQGSHAWYIKLQIRNARIPITSLEITTPSGDVVTPTHTSDNYWMASSPQGKFDGPLQVKMTAANGEILYDVVPRVEADRNAVLDGLNRVQVALDNNLPLP